MSTIEDEVRAAAEAHFGPHYEARTVGLKYFSAGYLAASRREPSEARFSADERAEVAAIEHASHPVRQYVADGTADEPTVHQLASSLSDLIVYLKWEREQRFTQPPEPTEPTTRHFAPYGSTNALCDETVPRRVAWDESEGEYADQRFTVKRDRTTCGECRFLMGLGPVVQPEPSDTDEPDLPNGHAPVEDLPPFLARRVVEPSDTDERAEHPCPDWPAPCNCNDPEVHDGH